MRTKQRHSAVFLFFFCTLPEEKSQKKKENPGASPYLTRNSSAHHVFSVRCAFETTQPVMQRNQCACLTCRCIMRIHDIHIDFFLGSNAPAMCSVLQKRALAVCADSLRGVNLRRTPRDGLRSRASVSALPHRLSAVPPAHARALACS